jgi:hypothetical protein
MSEQTSEATSRIGFKLTSNPVAPVVDFETVFTDDTICAHPSCETNLKASQHSQHLHLGGDSRGMICDLGVASFCSSKCCGDFAASLPLHFTASEIAASSTLPTISRKPSPTDATRSPRLTKPGPFFWYGTGGVQPAHASPASAPLRAAVSILRKPGGTRRPIYFH